MSSTSVGVWMIFLGYRCAFSCAMPIGRQCASGLSLLLSAIRFLTRSAAHGWYGAPPGVLLPMLPNGDPPPLPEPEWEPRLRVPDPVRARSPRHLRDPVSRPLREEPAPRRQACRPGFSERRAAYDAATARTAA